MIDLAAIEAEEVAEAAAPEHTPEPEPTPVEALVAVGAREPRARGGRSGRATRVSGAGGIVAAGRVAACVVGVDARDRAHERGVVRGTEGAVEPLPDRGERRQRKGWARMSRKVKRAR